MVRTMAKPRRTLNVASLHFVPAKRGEHADRLLAAASTTNRRKRARASTMSTLPNDWLH
jgi:hypothetical protein